MITAETKLACIEREIKMRRRVYPRWVTDGRMTQAKADDEIKTMEAIADDYRKAATQERLI
jgi:hypothetical protein